jgi:penicillin-binding protein 2
MRGRSAILYSVVAVLFAVIVLRLFWIQILDPQYKRSASNNVLRYEIQYPTRGEVYDRNGEFLVQSKEVYDLMVIPREVHPFDTLLMSSILGVELPELRKVLERARKHSPWQASMIFEMLPKDVKLQLDERNFAGFHTVYRNIRSYPRKVGGNLLGYVGRATEGDLKRDPFYRAADYVGRSGIERAYEEVLRGKKGVKVNMVDVHGIIQGSYADGIYDTMPVQGTAITTTIDLRLQALGEELLRNKVGSIVAIEPSTGEILMMVSAPTYDPEALVGRSIGQNYMGLLENPRRPLINRAVQSHYPPGSTFKPVVGLIGMQEGVLTPNRRYPCEGGYPYGRGVKCHEHPSPLDLMQAIQTSCNAYFCYVFRNSVDSKKYANVKEGFAAWGNHVRSFGFGSKLGSDFLDELPGSVPAVETYDKLYRGSWNSMTVLTLSIGQDRMLASPLQLANMVSIIANRGHYYIPHIVKRIHDRDSLDAKFYQRHSTDIDPRHFDPIVEGMWMAVNEPGGTGFAHKIDGLDMCGKTGTAQNPPYRDHSTFMCFAPREEPKIAVSVYVENGGFGATVAAPVASLIVEQYLTDTIRRPWLVEQVRDMQISYPAYDRKPTIYR